jgi:hypothetical protein
MKRPSFQFYPGDWLRSTDLRSCSVGARGLWIEMICLMHEGTPYGHLKVKDKVILPPNLARMVGATLQEVEGWLKELKDAGVCSTEGDSIFSRRMIRDEEIRRKRAAGGILGGNPILNKDNQKVAGRITSKVKQKPTPASASASASSSSKTIDAVDGLNIEAWERWIGYRKETRKPIKPASILEAQKELATFGEDQAAIVAQSIAAGYQGLFPLKTKVNGSPRGQPEKLSPMQRAIKACDDAFGKKEVIHGNAERCGETGNGQDDGKKVGLLPITGRLANDNPGHGG